ncbi:cellulose synthase subunit BcsC-related outer membrane protein [Paracidobacterium acidisoli]|uniref:Cellulose synthase operon C C-terminal domain-containing protein n=1 Tax=Paracidobacterium acidisoli TaxID=2303751 RepID=A0A372IUN0_9BACT|nr:cellulose synthase subunit BcsC-related outer membrane protein [Paracidobacterium acidisoli]MBT9330116.1 BCSC C-terminal domain-containing protein [Paracidobacterium acidisoli]
MEKVNRNVCRKLLLAVVSAGLILPSASLFAQGPAERMLLDKAHSLATGGHLDIAVQTWQQVLLADPNNREALLGIAKADMQLGKTDEAKTYLDRLRAAGGNAADISQIQAMPSLKTQSAQVIEAGRLAQAGRYADAMRIYRNLFGDNPPAGNNALAYYDTEAAIPEERARAIEGLRRLSKQFPADSSYAVTLGRVLTYDAKTRTEGIAILRRYDSVPAAKNALQQAEVWNAGAQNAAAASETAGEREPAPKVPAGDPLEAAAYRNLNAGRLDEARQQFQSLLDRKPGNARALSGLGYIAMRQQNFASAADYLERAQAAGEKGLEGAIGTAHFWQKMTQVGAALKAGDTASATDGYRAALALRPSSADALEGLAGALTQSGDYAEAADTFERAVHAAPSRPTAWLGLFLAQSSAGNAQAALDVSDRMPAAVRAQLAGSNPDYLRALAQDDLALGRKADSDRVIQKALALPFPNEGRDMPVQKQMQYAGLLLTAKKYEPAIRLYRQVVAQDPENSGAWLSLIAAQHQTGDDDGALATVGSMPQSVFDQQQNSPSFLVLIGSIYQSHQEWSRAQKYLEKAISLQPPAQSAIELQLADVYSAEGDQQKASVIYLREINRNPVSQQAWRGLLNALHSMNRDREAFRELASMPESVRLRLEEDPAYLQTLASIQSGIGQTQTALKTFAQIARIYSDQNADEPVDTQTQYGWLLLKAGDYAKLYTLVSGLAGFPDMTNSQLAEFHRLWSTWSVQQANALLAAGDQRRALAILVSAAETFPKNPDIYNALAAVYLKAGQPKQAVAIYATFDMDHATLPQCQGAIGAALAARDMNHAQAWLQSALDRFRSDPTILKMAAQYEQARGNNDRAAAYYRAALQAMGPSSPADIFMQPGNPGNPALPGNQPSPGQRLMQLLAPGAHASRLSEPSEGAQPDRNLDISWQNAPEAHEPTLGDFAQSGPDAQPLRTSQDRVSSLSGYASEDRLSEVRPSRTNPQSAGTAGGFSRSDAQAQPDDLGPADASGIESADSQTRAMMPADESGADREDAQPSYAQPGASMPVASMDDIPAPPRARAVQDTGSAHRLAYIPLERDTVSSSVDYLRPVSVRVQPEHLLTSQDSTPLPLSRSTDDANSAGQLQAAVRGISGQNISGQNGNQQDGLPDNLQPLPVLPAQSGSFLNGSSANSSTLSSELPPLTGPVTPVKQPKTEREQIEDQLAVLQGAASGWLGGSSGVDYRSGQPGYDRLAIYTAQIEGSNMLGPDIRTTVIARPVILNSGQAISNTTFQEGTLTADSVPYLQSSAGIGGEFQLRTPFFGASIGYTPHGFLIENVTGGLLVHPPSSHFTLTLARDPILDTQLSYSGLRDLGSQSATYPGNAWGGVMTTGGDLQVAFGDNRSGWYIQGGGQYITGLHVQDNRRIDGDAGAYWAVWHRPEYGSLSLGMNFFGMHYDHNLRYFTYGQGGYFSPAAYMLAGIPFTFNGHRGVKFHYRLTGSLGVQAFQEDSTPYYPLDLVLQTERGNPYYPEATNVGGNYTLDAEGSYAIAEHWYAGAYLDFNNSRDYASNKVGFFVRYMIRPQPASEETGPTGLFPTQGFRPLQVP